MTKRITSLILVTLLVVSLFVFVGCSNTDEMQQKIEELQQVLQTQTEILTGLQNTNASNAIQIANLQTALQEQAKQIEDMQKEMGEIILSYLSYKFSAIEEIESYANSKGQSNYLAENWVYVTNLVEMAKEQIGKQETKEEVDLLLPKIKKSIDLVPNDVVLEEKVFVPDDLEEISVKREDEHFGIADGVIFIDIDKHFYEKIFDIDDFWMIDNVISCEKTFKESLSTLTVQFEPQGGKIFTKNIKILSKLCFFKAWTYGLTGESVQIIG